MKTLERQFFRYLMRQIDYRGSNKDILLFIKPIDKIIIDFCNKKNCNKKQLLYYLNKWCSYGMYNYMYQYTVINSKLGWFNNLNCMPDRYLDIIPNRVISKLKRSNLWDS